MDEVRHLLSFEFVRHALAAGLLASVLCGVVGTFVVVKRLVFISGGISHAAFGGLGLCYFLGVDYRIGAGAVAVASALALSGSGKGRGRSHDAVIGVLWSVGMAVGIVFLHLTPGYAPNLQTYLFGNILTVTARDVWLTCGLVVALLALLALFWKELVAVAFDEAFAAVQGVPVRLALAGLMVAIALAVVFLIQLVGALLVIALLTIPPALALRLVDGFFAVMVTATVAGALMTLGGLAVSYAFDLPSGPAIVLLGAAMLLLAEGRQRLQRRLAQRSEPAGETFPRAPRTTRADRDRPLS
jgi:zinc transport system permease protein